MFGISREEVADLRIRYEGKKVHVVINDSYHPFEGDGVVTHVDDAGQIHGTWCGLAVILGEDSIQIIG
ncbi:MAG: DUF4314 domain-containing protein [Bacillus sp. (in: Bacteria)]|nr:DUF4314 domain-containing protein [Parasporobacterium sp.]MBR3381016.1 DUF4314 domain-containing protein [Bacillus sp. (in: firmicutes)]